jgi:hypothetical protein
VGNTEAEVGRSKNSKDGKTPYLMLRNTGRRYFGAFAYVKPSTGGTTFRLDRSQVDGFEHVSIRNVKKGTGYEVNCQLSNDLAVDEALRLAKMALEEVTRD